MEHVRQTLGDRIYEELRRRMSDDGFYEEPGGKQPPTRQMPPVSVLALDFGVGVPAVRTAMKRLRDEGRVIIVPGSGTWCVRYEDMTLSAFSSRLSDIVEQVNQLQAQVAAALEHNAKGRCDEQQTMVY